MTDLHFKKWTNRTKGNEETALTSDGWTQSFYKVSSGDVRFKKKALTISADLFVEDSVLDEGTLRINEVLGEGELQICLVESKEYRLLGFTSSEPLQTISYDASNWDVALTSPAQLIKLNVNNAMTSKILPEATGVILREKMRSFRGKNGPESLVFPMMCQSVLLSRVIKQCFALSASTDFKESDCLLLNWMKQDLLEIVSSLIDGIAKAEGPILTVGQRQRRTIAKEIESALWIAPIVMENGSSLDDLSEYFGCSRRLIQQAVYETFGVSFMVLKRSIRLQQAKNAIRTTAAKSVMQIAHEHDFYNAGRFAGYYKDFFGISPRQDRREIELSANAALAYSSHASPGDS